MTSSACPYRQGPHESGSARHRCAHLAGGSVVSFSGDANSPKEVIFTYFRPQSRYYLHTWIPRASFLSIPIQPTITNPSHRYGLYTWCNMLFPKPLRLQISHNRTPPDCEALAEPKPIHVGLLKLLQGLKGFWVDRIATHGIATRDALPPTRGNEACILS